MTWLDITGPEATSNYADVGEFHAKFDLPVARPERVPVLLDEGVMQYRWRFLDEELNELAEGIEDADLAQIADALVDLVYVAMGTAHLLGLPWQALWDEVQRANLSKERATSSDDPRSKRSHELDVVKPDGWTPPNIDGVLFDAGYPSADEDLAVD